MASKNIRFICYLFISLILPANADNNKEIPLIISINEEVYLKYKLENKNNICEELPDVKKTQVDRPLIELSIICLAFKEQGVTLNIKLLPTRSYSRALWLVKQGIVDIFAQTVWEQDIQNKYMHASIDMIRKGEFTKGIYTHEGHDLQTPSNEMIDFSEYIGIIPKAWLQDLAIVRLLSNKILENNYYPSIFKLLAINRADYTLMEFSSEDDLSVALYGYRLKPIKGIKIMIPFTRQYIVSKNTLNNQLIFDTLNQGLQALRDKKEIYKIYLDSGFISNKTKNWRIINEPPVIEKTNL